jgi:hypothetical protein
LGCGVIHHVSLERYTAYHDTATAPFDETARQVIAEARGIVDMRASRCGIGVGEQIGSSAWRWLMSRQPMRARLGRPHVCALWAIPARTLCTGEMNTELFGHR